MTLRTLTAIFLLLSTSMASVAPAAAQSPGTASPGALSTKAAQRGMALYLLSLDAAPGIDLPLESGLGLFTLGGGMDLRGNIPVVGPWLSLGGDLGYSWLPLRTGSSLSLASLLFGARFLLEPQPRFNLRAFLGVGGWYGFVNASMLGPDGLPYADQQGGGAAILGGAGFDLFLSPTLSVGLEAAYRECLGLAGSLRFSLGTTFHLDGLARKVDLEGGDSAELFPSLYKGFETAPIVRATLTNRERFPLTNVSVGLFIRDLMDSPTRVEVSGRIEPGQSRSVALPAVISNRVLSLAEEGRRAVELRCDYTINGKKASGTASAAIVVHGRNAITWDDDRKIASFMDPQAPAILGFAKPVAVMVRDREAPSIDLNLRMGMALFEALSQAGIGYVVDPNTPAYGQASGDPRTIDFVQYAVQTLGWKGGDCDDLTTLFCSLLESIGIESAFITVPGHIYAALPLRLSPEEARRTLSTSEDLIVSGGKAWLPIEITAMGKPFLEAWALGAREWREAQAQGQGAFHEVHACWESYTIAGSPPDRLFSPQPDMPRVQGRYAQALATVLARELGPKEAALLARIRANQGSAKDYASLGLLYARYGLLDKAEQAFTSALAGGESVALLDNLATVYRLKADWSLALEAFARVERLNPQDVTMLIGTALVNRELSNEALVRSYFARALQASPAIAARYPWLGQGGGADTARAEDLLGLRSEATWVEGE